MEPLPSAEAGIEPAEGGGHISIVEVAPRDGLQNEPEVVPTEVKVRFIEALADAGLARIEAGSFVSPKWVPQLSDADEVLRRLAKREGVVYSVLVPNEKGYAAARAAGAREVAVFTAASDTFNVRNTNVDVKQSLERFAPVLAAARADGVPARGYVSCAFYCPYEGKVAPARVAWVVDQLFGLGCREVSLADTVGRATPSDVAELLDLEMGSFPIERLALHFHDTWGAALANVMAGLDVGITVFDASAGGLGGCPYAPGATGNLATEDLVALLDAEGFSTGVDLSRLAAATAIMETHLARRLPGRAYQALRARERKESV